MRIISRRAALGLALAAPTLAPARRAEAQHGWTPDRPVRLVVPFGPGGSQDMIGRLLAQAVSPNGASRGLGEQVVVENRAGAGGIVGAEAVARATPDGTTLLQATAGQLTIAKAVGRKLSYDPIASFAPVIYLVDSPVALLVCPQLQVGSLKELLELARTTSMPLPYGSTGIGTNTHLIMEDLKARLHLNVEHIPYRGAATAFADLLAGRIALMFVSVPSVLGFSGGQLKVMGVTSRTRFPTLPDVPTMIEAGVKDFEASIWTGIVAPAGTPPEAIDRLHASFAAAMTVPGVKKELMALGAMPNGAGPEAFGAMLRADLARWTSVARPLNIDLD